jgi:hypothetical protein
VAAVAIISAAVIALAAPWSWAGTARRAITRPHVPASTSFRPLRIPAAELRSLADQLAVRGGATVRSVPRGLSSHATPCFVAGTARCSLTPCVYEAAAPTALPLLLLPATPAAPCRRPAPIQISTTVLSAVRPGQPPAARATK